MLAVPFSDYYVTMPKPEPIQLFLLALFCYFFVKTNANPSWHWIFAGLAFGTKISTLPALVVFISLSFAIKLKSNKLDHCREQITNSVKMFFIGLAIAVPILLWPLILIVSGCFILRWSSKKFNLSIVSQCLFGLFWAFVIYFASRKVLSVWISSTFLNTTHGADQSSINPLSWIEYFINTWLITPPPIGVLLTFTILTYILINIITVSKVENWHLEKETTALAIAIAGLVLNAAIFLTTKRLWGFYLYPGMILIIVGTVFLIDLNITRQSHQSKRPNNKLNTITGYSISLILLFISGLYWMPETINRLTETSHRTLSTEYSLQYASYRKVVEFLNNYSFNKNKRIHVIFSPTLFPPKSNEKFEIIEFWGPYTDWEKRPDVIIIDVRNTPKGQPVPKDSPGYNNFLIERKGYATHVIDKGQQCKSNPCFVRELELPNGGEVLVLSKPD
ncbi:hypothetical protein M1B34_15515 [Pseudomonas sp. MAFF 302030]|uniref:Uncharacterized protein n=1 Tax=Pseudomonas morbosilactucae TaxID=2938197 RepID=A0A9X1YVW5_9PSED|nr:hypothetical protein [Pseudomonas morbosilactucae]MCK9799077.1 hypothetical protein [Pseudomonas morbosilactucae]